MPCGRSPRRPARCRRHSRWCRTTSGRRAGCRRRARAVDESALAVRAARGDPLADDDIEQPRHDHHGGDDGRLEIGRCGEHRDRHEEEELHHEPRSRRGPGALATPPSAPTPGSREQRAAPPPSQDARRRSRAGSWSRDAARAARPGARRPARRASERRRAAHPGRPARARARPGSLRDGVRHARSLPLVGRAHVVECGAGVVVHFRPPLLDRRLGDDGTAALRLVGARLGQLAPELVGGVDCGRPRGGGRPPGSPPGDAAASARARGSRARSTRA